MEWERVLDKEKMAVTVIKKVTDLRMTKISENLVQMVFPTEWKVTSQVPNC
jgi:hypothetical protein